MKRFSIPIIGLLLLAGCAGFHSRDFIIDNAGAVYVRDIGSRGQMSSIAQTNVEVGAEVPDEVPVPITVGVTGNGLFATHNVKITNITGPVVVELILTDTQNVPVPESLSKILIPSAYPFADTTETEYSGEGYDTDGWDEALAESEQGE